MRGKNHGLDRIDASITLHFVADYADIFEIRGMRRRGSRHGPGPRDRRQSGRAGLWGLDGVVRRTAIRFSPAPFRLTANAAVVNVSLQPQREATIHMTVACDREGSARAAAAAQRRADEAETALERYKAWSCHLETSNEQVNGWINRAVSDLHMMTTDRPTGPIPMPGSLGSTLPLGAMESSPRHQGRYGCSPSWRRGVLAYLASTQLPTSSPKKTPTG